MDINLFANNLKKIKGQRNYSLCLNVFLAFMLFLSLIVILRNSNYHTTVVIPAGFSKEVSVSQDGVSDNFLTEWTEFLANLKLNVTPSRINKQQKSLLAYVDSSKYGDIKKHLIEEQERVIRDDITTVFFPESTKVIDNGKLTTKISGLLRVFIGSEINKEVRVSYLLKYKLNNNGLLLTEFKEIENV